MPVEQLFTIADFSREIRGNYSSRTQDVKFLESEPWLNFYNDVFPESNVIALPFVNAGSDILNLALTAQMIKQTNDPTIRIATIFFNLQLENKVRRSRFGNQEYDEACSIWLSSLSTLNRRVNDEDIFLFALAQAQWILPSFWNRTRRLKENH